MQLDTALQVSLLVLVWLVIVGLVGTLVIWFRILRSFQLWLQRSYRSWAVDLTQGIIKLIRGRG